MALGNFLVFDENAVIQLGVATAELAKFEKLTYEEKTSSQLGEVQNVVPYHLKNLVYKIVFDKSCNPQIDHLIHNNEITLVLKAHVREDNIDFGKSIRIKGVVTNADNGKFESGQKIERSIEISAWYVKETLAGMEVLEIDKKNFVYKVNGEDKLAAVKACIGLG